VVQVRKPAERHQRVGDPPTVARGLCREFSISAFRLRRRGDCRPGSLRRIAAAERRDIGAALHVNQKRIVAAGLRIVARQRIAQPSGLHAHDRVGLRIEIGAAAERLDGDRIGLEPVAFARQRRLDDEGKETRQPERIAKGGAPNDPGEFSAHIGGARHVLGPQVTGVSPCLRRWHSLQWARPDPGGDPGGVIKLR